MCNLEIVTAPRSAYPGVGWSGWSEVGKPDCCQQSWRRLRVIGSFDNHDSLALSAFFNIPNSNYIPMIIFEKAGPFAHSRIGWYFPSSTSRCMCCSLLALRTDQLITFAGQSFHDQELEAEQTRGTFHVLQLSLSDTFRSARWSYPWYSLVFVHVSCIYLYQNASRKA